MKISLASLDNNKSAQIDISVKFQELEVVLTLHGLFNVVNTVLFIRRLAFRKKILGT